MIDDTTDGVIFNMQSEEFFNHCMENNIPYFGIGLRAQQGKIERHIYMDKLIFQECLNRDDEPYDILEIGSYAGQSAVTWAKAIQKYNKGNGKVFCVDPWESYCVLTANQWDTEKIMNRALGDGQAFRLFLHNINTSGCKENVAILKAKSDEVLPSLDSQGFNLVYIDGDHRRKQFKRDVMNSMPLIEDQGIICGDDLEAEQDKVIGKFAEHYSCAKETYPDGTMIRYHPGVTKGVWEIFGHVSSWDGFWAMRKCGDNWEEIVLDVDNPEMPEHLKTWDGIFKK